MARPSTILFRPILLRPNAAAPTISRSAAGIAIRFASSSSSSKPATPSQSRTSTSSTPLPLPWPEYLGLRKQRRLWSSITTIPTTFLGLFLGGSYFASLESDPSQLIMGIEAMYVYGGATLGCMALGYLAGPTVGSSLFSLTHRSISAGKNSPLEIMDREFYNRIKRNRADPTLQSAQNISPDFYGEKITSLSTYRRWLRDQAVYKRKAMHGVPAEDA
ncbi:presequence translocated-associated motor subunit PAM17, mitochondrial [Kwoniella mangroviensis CBS 10435]|uniref:Presequence translocated-associated motor subunit PAM17 n=1 Tax=Kwoniella mangroviensis CBS 10435 TaxID=1331196 RepID=A0A1B9J221_9TREE|nr:presequence translocated-associated motor subunit PAM17, mitochondrial [Kwoniella mangroviensis CBS 8507]OCF61832.1 presequence translocated-associated motor subunit PAM17, mitochondrial [Kwoniella mangroviensis CBS 10435]OCF67154.1 presequence translocated-associated motor subunit PAM17, mitochondrial [Kwoniella mangroviensis CBS 8507]OCF77850.1 presequence translocated-associated motor subunit PAM17, mitochondrial [Kwoniella mangroviensis CBS 8886]